MDLTLNPNPEKVFTLLWPLLITFADHRGKGDLKKFISEIAAQNEQYSLYRCIHVDIREECLKLGWNHTTVFRTDLTSDSPLRTIWGEIRFSPEGRLRLSGIVKGVQLQSLISQTGRPGPPINNKHHLSRILNLDDHNCHYIRTFTIISQWERRSRAAEGVAEQRRTTQQPNPSPRG